MRKPDLTALTTRLEELLGCPHDPAGRTPYPRLMELDERESSPSASVRMLSGWGVLESVLVRAQTAAPARLAAIPQEPADAQG